MVIDCSSVLAVHPEVKVAQLQAIQFHSTRLCYALHSCRTATLDFFFDLAESKVAVFLCSILTSDGIPFCFGKNSFL